MQTRLQKQMLYNLGFFTIKNYKGQKKKKGNSSQSEKALFILIDSQFVIKKKNEIYKRVLAYRGSAAANPPTEL